MNQDKTIKDGNLSKSDFAKEGEKVRREGGADINRPDVKPAKTDTKVNTK